jgi:hypothetical protein
VRAEERAANAWRRARLDLSSERPRVGARVSGRPTHWLDGVWEGDRRLAHQTTGGGLRTQPAPGCPERTANLRHRTHGCQRKFRDPVPAGRYTPPCAGDRSPVAAEGRSARWLDRSVQAVHIPAREGGERPPRTRRREQAAGMGPQPDSNGHWPRVQRAVPGRRSRSLQAGRPACASVKPTRVGPTTGMDHRRPHHGRSTAGTSCTHVLHLPWMACARPPSPRRQRLHWH